MAEASGLKSESGVSDEEAERSRSESPDDATPAERLRGTLLEKHADLVAVAAGLPTLLYGLGILTHASREQLLGLGPPLTYPHQTAVLISLDVLRSLPVNGLASLFSEGWLRGGVLALLGLMGVVWAAERWLPEKRRQLALTVVLVLSWWILLFGFRIYSAALHPRHAPSGIATAFRQPAGIDLAARAEVEASSWLVNDDDRNADRRQALGGLGVWFLLAAGWLGWRVWRLPGAGILGRRLLLGAYALLLALIAAQLPRAHVMGAWGLSYPSLRMGEGEGCDVALRTAIEAQKCCAFDVSAGGEPQTVLLVGEGCPDGTGFRTWPDESSSCWISGARRVVDDGC